MSVTLDHVTRTVDGVPTIRDVSLTLERGTLNVLLGPTLSGQDLDHAAARRSRQADAPAACWSTARTSPASTCRKRSVAMVYQQFINYPSLTVYENIASPLRVQGKPRAEIETRVQEAAKLLQARALSEAHAAAIVRRPAAAHRDRARAGQGRRSGAARRAARQSRLQAARGTAHRTAAHLRGVRRDLRLRDDRAFRGAAARRRHRLHVGRRGAAGPATRRRSIASPRRCEVAQVFSDPPLNIVGIEKKNGSVQYAGGIQAPATGLYAVAGRRPLSRRLPRPSARSGQRSSPAAMRFTPP